MKKLDSKGKCPFGAMHSSIKDEEKTSKKLEIIENIALFDLDGTLADYDSAILRDYNKIKSPEDPEYSRELKKYPYMRARIDMIRNQTNWWYDLDVLDLGYDLYLMAVEVGFKIHILTQGPKSCPNSWGEKLRWVQQKINIEDVTITRDKGLVYGKILVDDYPEYIERWLKWRKNGLVIMPAHDYNKDYKHPNVIRYDGTNNDEVKIALKKSLNR